MGLALIPITQRTFAGVHLDLLPSSHNIGHNTATFVIFGSEVCEGKGFCYLFSRGYRVSHVGGMGFRTGLVRL